MLQQIQSVTVKLALAIAVFAVMGADNASSQPPPPVEITIPMTSPPVSTAITAASTHEILVAHRNSIMQTIMAEQSSQRPMEIDVVDPMIQSEMKREVKRKIMDRLQGYLPTIFAPKFN